MEIRKRRGVCISNINNKQNLKKYAILQLYFSIQEGILGEKLNHLSLLNRPTGHWQCFTIRLESPEFCTVPDNKRFQFVACNSVLSKTIIVS